MQEMELNVQLFRLSSVFLLVVVGERQYGTAMRLVLIQRMGRSSIHRSGPICRAISQSMPNQMPENNTNQSSYAYSMNRNTKDLALTSFVTKEKMVTKLRGFTKSTLKDAKAKTCY